MTSAKPNYSVIPSTGGDAVLLVASGESWSLPRHDRDEPAEINEEICGALGVDVVTTGCARQIRTDEGIESVFAHEIRSPEAVPRQGVRWFRHAELSGLDLPAGQRDLLDDWFTNLDGGAEHLPRVPWARRGWFDEASSWILGELDRAGVVATGQVEQFLVTPWSHHLRVPTDDGGAYFKATAAAFGHEGALTRLLGEWFPGDLPDVLAIDADRHWMLTRDVGPFTEITPVPESRDDYERVLARYAEMQRRAVGEVDRLIASGCPDWRLENLPALYEKLLADEDYLLLGTAEGLSVEELETLRGFAPRFAEMCAEVASCGLPETVVNLDFWRGNIAYTADGFRIFDWGESAIAHPLFSLVTVLRDFELTDYPGSAESRQRLIDTYLSAWSDHLPAQRLAEAFQPAQVAAIVCRTLCWRSCLAQLDELWRFPTLRRAVVINLKRIHALIPDSALRG